MIGRSKHLRNWMKVGQDNTRPEDLIGPNGQLKRCGGLCVVALCVPGRCHSRHRN